MYFILIFLYCGSKLLSVLNGSFSFWFVSCPQGLAAPAVLEGTPESDQEKRRWDFTPITYDHAKSGTASKYIGKGHSLQFQKKNIQNTSSRESCDLIG